MRTILVAIPFLFIASSAFAQARPDSLRLSCAATRGLVQQSGAIVIGTGPNIYDRYVVDAGFCTITQTTEPAWLQTGDDPRCLIGRRCIERRIKRR